MSAQTPQLFRSPRPSARFLDMLMFLLTPLATDGSERGDMAQIGRKFGHCNVHSLALKFTPSDWSYPVARPLSRSLEMLNTGTFR